MRARTLRENVFFLKHFSLCLLRVYLVEPHSSSAANCPGSSGRTLWTAFHSVLIWNSHRHLPIMLLKVLILFQVHARCVCNLLNSECLFLYVYIYIYIIKIAIKKQELLISLFSVCLSHSLCKKENLFYIISES